MALLATFAERDLKGNDVVREYLLSCSVQEDTGDEALLAAGLDRDELLYGLTAGGVLDHTVAVVVEVCHLDVGVDSAHEVTEFTAGDSVAVQRSLCTRVGVPLAGCESHRLQLGFCFVAHNSSSKVADSNLLYLLTYLLFLKNSSFTYCFKVK